jgi:hypothetical protein
MVKNKNSAITCCSFWYNISLKIVIVGFMIFYQRSFVEQGPSIKHPQTKPQLSIGFAHFCCMMLYVILGGWTCVGILYYTHIRISNKNGDVSQQKWGTYITMPPPNRDPFKPFKLQELQVLL